MKANHPWLKQITKLGLLLMMGVSMSADAGLFGFGGTHWKEEVLLHDGSKIIVERSMIRGGHGIAHQELVTEERLTFTMPGTNQNVTWADKFSEDLGGSSFSPMMLEISKGTVYLVVTPMGCLSYNKWGRPNPPYVIFKYQGKEWTRIPLQELPAEFKMPNLIHSSPDSESKKTGQSIVSAETIKKLIENYKKPEAKTILRELVKPGTDGSSVNCLKTDYYGKAGWLSLDWFSDQPTYEACLKFCANKGVSPQNCPCNSLFKGK